MKIKKPQVNYTKLRWNNINSPEYRHLWLLLGWVWYLIMFFLTENLIQEEKCHVVHSFMDDLIPFNENFILAYYSWYLLIAGSILYFLLYDIESFVRMQKFIIATQIIGISACIFWPSVQYLRPTELVGNSFCMNLVRAMYSIDTPTGVCPSMHVAFALAIFSAWCKKDMKLWWKVLMGVWVALISVSVCFVKQHSYTDVWTAVLVCAMIELVLFGRYWAARIREVKNRLFSDEVTEG